MRSVYLLLLFLIPAAIATAQPQPLVYLDVENIGIQQVANGMAAITADIRMYNPNHYKVKLKDADVDAFINDTYLGKLGMKDKFEVPKEDTFLLPAMLNVEMKNLLPNALQVVLSNGIVDMKLAGSVKAGRYGIYVKVPLNYEGKQDVSAILDLK